jgi:hypothetical protein
MLLFSINRIRGYENPNLNIIVIELCSTGGCPLEEAHEHCFHIQSVISVIILISFQCYCGECSGYITVILPLLTFYFCSTCILYQVYCNHSNHNYMWHFHKDKFIQIMRRWNVDLDIFFKFFVLRHFSLIYNFQDYQKVSNNSGFVPILSI